MTMQELAPLFPTPDGALDNLRRLMDSIDAFDQVPAPTPAQYGARNALVYMALGQAEVAGVPVGIRWDQNEMEWPVVYFQLPTGQVSWHLPLHRWAWDGHDGPEKHARIQHFVAPLRERA